MVEFYADKPGSKAQDEKKPIKPYRRLKATDESDKIEINKDRIFAINDPLRLAFIFFPQKNATQKRAAFLAIFFEIKNAPKQRLKNTDHIAEKFGISKSAIIKARSKMSRMGLIRYHWTGYGFSTMFRNSLEELIKRIEIYKVPATPNQLHGEEIHIEMAKHLKVDDYQLMKNKRKRYRY